MVEYQKFIFNTDYSNSAQSIEKARIAKEIEAREMLADEMQEIKNTAYEQGFNEGQKKALEILQSEMEQNLTAMAENLKEINSFKTQLQSIFEEQMTASLNHIVNQLYFNTQELFNQQLLQQSIDKAIENLPYSTNIIIKVPTNTANYLKDANIEEKLKSKGVVDFSIVEDPSLQAQEVAINWDQSGIFISKKETFEKISNALKSFVNQQDQELSEQIIHQELTAEEEIQEPEQLEQIAQEPETEQQLEPQELKKD